MRLNYVAASVGGGVWAVLVVVADDDPHRPPEDCAPAAARTSRAQNWQILRIWHCRPTSTNGHVCAYCTLAGLFVVSFIGQLVFNIHVFTQVIGITLILYAGMLLEAGRDLSFMLRLVGWMLLLTTSRPHTITPPVHRWGNHPF